MNSSDSVKHQSPAWFNGVSPSAFFPLTFIPRLTISFTMRSKDCSLKALASLGETWDGAEWRYPYPALSGSKEVGKYQPVQK
jgi:hypothetical protein